jgi:eukaryotic-like serine/threonine-protein kinase
VRLAVGHRLGPYEVVGTLGSGGMGEVYRARDTRLGREVAIKVLPAERMADEGRRRRFVQEARAASALNHPNIVTIHEIEAAEGVDFIVMECVPGQTLASLIPKHGMPVSEALRVAIPIADAVAAAHSRGIVHRDLKPANVIVGREGVVKVLDFGLAKLVADETGDSGDTLTTASGPSGVTGPGVITGTAAYMSPEQATGGRVDARSDVFSLGAVLYEMVTGRRAFSGETVSETLTAVVKEQPRAPREVVPEIPEGLEKLILRCLRKEPERRFQHMSDLKVELQELKEDLGSGPTTPSVPARRKRGLWLAAGLVGALLSVAGGLLLRHARRPEVPAPSLIPLTSTPGSETRPTFSPDGDQIAFEWNGEKGDNWDIYVKMIGSPEARRLTTDPALEIMSAWSPDGRQIAFLRRSSGSTALAIHVISPLGGADRKVSDQPIGGPLSWSPDGRWLATGAPWGFDAGRSAVAPGIRFVEVATGEVRNITSPAGSAYDLYPAFSPDGRHLAYASCLGLACHVDVVELGPDDLPKGAARRLTQRLVWPSTPLAWTRDSASVVYGDQLNGHLWRVSIQGNVPPERIEIAGFGAYWPATAVSRNRLAFVRSGSHSAIYRFEPGRPARVVASSSLFSSNTPHLSPDGSRIAFESNRGGGGDEVWLAASDGSNPVQLTHGPGLWQGSPRWSLDGRRIAFDSLGEDGLWHIWTIDADGGALHRVTSYPANHNHPAWSQDGRFLYFSSDRTGTQTIWRSPAAGGPEEQVARTGGGRSQEAADGKTLYVQRAALAASPLLAVPLAGGPERTVIDCVPRYSSAVGAAGVYHVGCGGDPSAVPLFLWDPATGRDRLLGTLERPGTGLTVSTDGETVLYTRSLGEGTDLMLIENFR